MSEIEKVQDVWHLPEKDLKRLKNARVILGMSGGKDSTACALLLERHGIEFERVFLDTGWEHPVVFDYLRGTLEPRFGKIDFLKSKKYPGGLKEAILKKQFPPNYARRYCTSIFKLDPLKLYFEGIEDEIINVVGIRAQESQTRSLMPRWEDNEMLDCEIFRPLLSHSFDDVIQMHGEGEIPPNPLYLQGANRVGCFPCVFAVKSDFKMLDDVWPERVQEIHEIEQELTRLAHERYANDDQWSEKIKKNMQEYLAFNRTLLSHGKSLALFKAAKKNNGEGFDPEEWQKYLIELDEIKNNPRDPDFLDLIQKQLNKTFFYAQSDKGIYDLVEWSKTTHGGRQMALFDATSRDGCMRWGMCESPLADKELLKISEPKK